MAPFANLTETRKYFIDVALQAGSILNDLFGSKTLATTEKSGVDFTTQADIQADGFIQRLVKEKYPHATLLTEETAPGDYQSLINVENLVVVDPLDGTTNFSRGDPYFAISIALVEFGKPKVGVVYLPKKDELYWAQSDHDSSFYNDNSIRVSETDNLKKSVVTCAWSWDLVKRDEMYKLLGKIYPNVRAFITKGSAAAELAGLARGDIDIFCIPGLKPWDVAAAALFVEKAGGKITKPDGEEWNVFEPDILATNGILHDPILELLNKN